MEARITVAIPTYNAIRYLPRVFDGLLRQDITFKLLLCDNESEDGTGIWLRSPVVHKYWHSLSGNSIRGWRQLNPIPRTGDKQRDVATVRASLTQAVSTEYIFMLDQDVVLPPGALRDIASQFRAERLSGPKLGALGIPYELKTTHVMSGALFLSTDVAKEVDYTLEHLCVCKCIAKTLGDKGLALEHWARGEFGRHLRREY